MKKGYIISGFIIVFLLAYTYMLGDEPKNKEQTAEVTVSMDNTAVVAEHNETTENNEFVIEKELSEDIDEEASEEMITPAPEIVKTEEEISEGLFAGNDKNEEINPDEKTTAPLSEQPAETDEEDKQLTCTLSVRCDTVREDKYGIIPDNGVIYPETTVVFYDGESVFNLLMRELKQNKIHVEYTNVPVFNSAYIEGIANIYEFDYGELSGWMYKVNGDFPNFGCSLYTLKPGDRVEWVYTCDLGKDVGGENSARNGM